MITYIIYAICFLIFLFIGNLTIKAINSGIEAKQENKKININQKEKFEISNIESSKLSSELKELKKLRDNGILNDEEFSKAKKKILEKD